MNNAVLVFGALLLLGACGESEEEAERYHDPAPAYLGSAIPPYPRAERVSSRASGGRLQHWSTHFNTVDTYYQVLDFYADAVEREGFGIREPMGCLADQGNFSAVRTDDTRIEVQARRVFETTQVAIRTEHGPEPSFVTVEGRHPRGSSPMIQPGGPRQPPVRTDPGPARRCAP